MNSKPPLIPLFLCLLLAGCSEYDAPNREMDQHDEGMGIWFVTEYDGTSRGDDLDLWARFTVPSGQPDHWYQVNPIDHSGSISCFKYRDDFEGKPWWLEITLYDEPDGQVVSRQRWPDLDCLTYRIHVDENGQMSDLHEGHWGDETPRNNIPSLGLWTILACIGGVMLALRRR